MAAPTSGNHSSPLLEARGIERRYGGLTVWRNLDLLVHSGELLLLAGPNGAGKSTLLRALAGLARPPRGTVRVLGEDLYARDAIRGNIGFVSHESLLYHDLTASENLQFAAALHQLPDADALIENALHSVAMHEHRHQRVSRFSRGMLQRLSLARATLHAPPLLLLDEPFTGLDPSAAAALRARLKADVERGHAIVCVTHEPGEIWDLATRVVVLAGKTIRLDTAKSGSLDAFRSTYAALVA